MYIISHLKDVTAKASEHKGDKFIILYDKGSMMSVEQHLLLTAPNVEFLNFSDYPSAEAAIWFTIGRRCNAKEEAAIIGHVPYDIEKCPAWPGIHYFESMDDLYAKPKKKAVKKAPAKAPDSPKAEPKAPAGKERTDAGQKESKGSNGDGPRAEDGAVEAFKKLLEGKGEETAGNWEYVLAGIQRSSSVYSLGQCLSMHLLDKDLSRGICDSIRDSYAALKEAADKCPRTEKFRPV